MGTAGERTPARENAMIGLISAMNSEIDLLRNAMTERREEARAGVIFYLGKIDGVDVVLVSCGVGKVNAAVHTQILIDFYHPAAIIQSGVAGALTSDLKIFDVVVGSELVYHDMQDFILESFDSLEKVYYADPALVRLVTDVEPNARVGRIATGDIFVSDPETKHAIREKTGALSAEMEGAAVAHTATLNHIPFVVIRVISDAADADPELVFAVFEVAAAQNCSAIVRKMLPKVAHSLA